MRLIDMPRLKQEQTAKIGQIDSQLGNTSVITEAIATIRAAWHTRVDLAKERDEALWELLRIHLIETSSGVCSHCGRVVPKGELVLLLEETHLQSTKGYRESRAKKCAKKLHRVCKYSYCYYHLFHKHETIGRTVNKDGKQFQEWTYIFFIKSKHGGSSWSVRKFGQWVNVEAEMSLEFSSETRIEILNEFAKTLGIPPTYLLFHSRIEPGSGLGVMEDEFIATINEKLGTGFEGPANMDNQLKNIHIIHTPPE